MTLRVESYLAQRLLGFVDGDLRGSPLVAGAHQRIAARQTLAVATFEQRRAQREAKPVEFAVARRFGQQCRAGAEAQRCDIVDGGADGRFACG